ncbi:MAG: sugar phosphate isomerase/epimerase [Pseudomonadota bacterium]|nr:sugar phosphate isomerase/epimerase [Pseudomonadota bacterium]
MTHPIGLAALTVLELTPPEMVSCAADAGFDRVGLRLIPATPEEVQHAMVGDTPLVRETERRLKDTGIHCFDIEIFRLKPDTRVADYRAALETGARLGAREALIAGNDPDEPRLIENFAAFCDLARPYGIGINIEPMPWTDCRNFAQGVRVVTAAGRDNGGVLIDPIHFDRGGSDASEIPKVPRARFRYMQLCDAPAERPSDIHGLLHQARAERLMPGDGGLDLKGILRGVPNDIPLSLEIPMQTLSKSVSAVERTRQMLAKTRQLLETLKKRI